MVCGICDYCDGRSNIEIVECYVVVFNYCIMLWTGNRIIRACNPWEWNLKIYRGNWVSEVVSGACQMYLRTN